MERASDLDGLLGAQEPHATFHDARLVAVDLDYRNNDAIVTWELCVGDPDDSMRSERERRRAGRLVLSGLLFWVIDPPKALDARPGLPWLTGCGVLPDAPTETGRQLARLLSTGTAGCYFFFASWNAFMYCGARRLTFEWV